MQHVLPLILTQPAMAKSVLRYTLGELQQDIFAIDAHAPRMLGSQGGP